MNYPDAVMNSFNHYAYGAVAGWIFSSMVEIGYDKDNLGGKYCTCTMLEYIDRDGQSIL